MTAAAGATDEAGWFTAAVSDELRAHMARKRISGRELARRLHVSHQWMSQRTKGAIALSTDDIERISGILGIGPMDLLRGAVTGADTHGFTPASRPDRPALFLVSDTSSRYQNVAARYGSSPPWTRNNNGTDDAHSAGLVNDADSA